MPRYEFTKSLESIDMEAIVQALVRLPIKPDFTLGFYETLSAPFNQKPFCFCKLRVNCFVNSNITNG